MDVLDKFIEMSPYYILGIVILICVYFSPYRQMLTVKLQSVKKFIIFMLFITLIRIIAIKFDLLPYDLDHMRYISDLIKWQLLLMVFWEDATHTIPLAILKQHADTKFKKILYYLLLVITMISFAAGHTYQGGFSAALLSLYIPVTIYYGLRIGFGTVMIAHVLYDIITYIGIKFLCGAL